MQFLRPTVLLAFALCLRNALVAAIQGPTGLKPARSNHATSVIQMSMRTRVQMGARALAGGTFGFKLHRRREKVHIWSKPCRKLPMEKRPACERKVDHDVLNDKKTECGHCSDGRGSL